MYNKQSDNEYIAKSELIFQIIDKNNSVEIDRQRLDLKFSKDSFQKIKLNNLQEGQIEFVLDRKSYMAQIQLIDLESKSYEITSISICPVLRSLLIVFSDLFTT